MLRRTFTAAFAVVVVAMSTAAHDLFLKLDSYFLAPHTKATVRVMNGTFQKSEGAVAQDRLIDLSVFANGVAVGPESLAWRAEKDLSIMEFETADSGTYLVGVSTRPREISLKAADFNNYLAEDGLPDILAARKKNRELGKDARERYSKHVRAVLQVGDKLTDDYKRQLNYAVEIIPQANPYSLKAGQTLPVLCLLEGQPLKDQFVIAGREARDGKITTEGKRTDAAGMVRFQISGAGKWFVKLIHMTPVAEPGLNYESKWATLTFQIR